MWAPTITMKYPHQQAHQQQCGDHRGCGRPLAGAWPAARILQALPAAKRTQVHFQHLLSLILFLQTMDVGTDKIPAFIRKAPFMYQRNPTLHLQPKILYLQTLGLHRKDMCLLVLKYPYSLYPPMENIQAHIQCLKSLPLEDQDLQRLSE